MKSRSKIEFNCGHRVWKKQKLTVAQKAFRVMINLLWFISAKCTETFISRKFLRNCSDSKIVYVNSTQCGNWKNEKFSLTKEIFRQINYLATYLLVKPLLSRNFCQKYVRENFRNFLTVLWKFSRTFVTKNFVKATVKFY